MNTVNSPVWLSNAAINELIFGKSGCQELDADDYVIALLSDINEHLKQFMQQKCGKPYASPFEDTGNYFIGRNFSVYAYLYDDTEQQYNFKCGDIEIRWYRTFDCETTINGKYSPKTIINMYNFCLKEIKEMSMRYEEKNHKV